jgi:hypothetical protein
LVEDVKTFVQNEKEVNKQWNSFCNKHSVDPEKFYELTLLLGEGWDISKNPLVEKSNAKKNLTSLNFSQLMDDEEESEEESDENENDTLPQKKRKNQEVTSISNNNHKNEIGNENKNQYENEDEDEDEDDLFKEMF